MTIASGIGSQFGLATESVYGTIVTPARFLEFDNETFQRTPAYIESQGLRAGSMGMSASRVKPTTRTAGGGVVLDVPSKGFGKLLDLLHTLVVTPTQQGSTAAYKQSHIIGSSPIGKSATVQFNKPDSSGTDRPFTYPGSVVKEVEFTCPTSGTLKSNWTFDAQDELTATALAVASYATGVHVFDFTQGAITLGGSPLANVLALTSLKITQGMKDDRYFLGVGGTKGKPIPNALMAITGQLQVEWASMAAYNLFVSGAMSALVLDFEGPTIASPYNEAIAFTAPAVQLRGESPQVSGPDVLQTNIPFNAYFDDATSKILQIDYISVDTTL